MGQEDNTHNCTLAQEERTGSEKMYGTKKKKNRRE